MKILMLILSNDGGPRNLYSKLEEIKRLYIHSYTEIEAYFYKCNPLLESDYEIIGDTVYLKTEEKYPELWKKFWLVLKAFEERLHEFDFICRPNLSSFIIMDRYLQHLQEIPKNQFCSGLKFFGGQPIPFPSGYLFTITSDIAIECIHNTIIENNEGIDDRCLGLILNEINIPISTFPCIELENHFMYENEDKLIELQENLNDPTIFLIRIRHIACYETLFGSDYEDRTERDLTIQLLFLIKFYHFDKSIFEKLNIENYLPHINL